VGVDGDLLAFAEVPAAFDLDAAFGARRHFERDVFAAFGDHIRHGRGVDVQADLRDPPGGQIAEAEIDGRVGEPQDVDVDLDPFAHRGPSGARGVGGDAVDEDVRFTHPRLVRAARAAPERDAETGEPLDGHPDLPGGVVCRG